MKSHMLDYFEETVKRRGNTAAVRHHDQEITFAGLQEKAEKLGTWLLSVLEGSVNTPVAVFLPKEIPTVIADLGILYSSNFFMNLDVKTPKERIGNILELVKPSAVVTSRKYAKALADTAVPVLLIDELDSAFAGSRCAFCTQTGADRHRSVLSHQHIRVYGYAQGRCAEPSQLL